MASFTFAAGNTRALLRLPLYALGFLAGLVVPRTDALWVVGCGIGLGEGAVPLYDRAREQDGVRVVWLATTAAERDAARARGYDAELKSSPSGLWLTLRARVLVVTHGAGDLNRYGTRGGFLVQLWHGIPLKKLHLDSPVAGTSRLGALMRPVLTRGYRIAGARINLFPVASARIVGRIASAFGIPAERIAVTGDPRDDVLLDGDPAQRRASARALLEASLGPLPPRVIMYAPTWRDGAPDPAAPDDATWSRIAAWLDEHDACADRADPPAGERGLRRRTARIRPRAAARPAQAARREPGAERRGCGRHGLLVHRVRLRARRRPDRVPRQRRRPSTSRRAGLYEPYDRFSGGQQVVGLARCAGAVGPRARRSRRRSEAHSEAARRVLRPP